MIEKKRTIADVLGDAAKIREICGNDDEQLLHDCLEGETDIFEWLDWALSKRCEKLEAVDGIKIRMENIKKRYEAAQAEAKRFDDLIVMLFSATGQKNFKGKECTISRKVKPQTAIITDEAAIPEEFLITETKINKKAINDAIKDGRSVAGVTLDNGGETFAFRR